MADTVTTPATQEPDAGTGQSSRKRAFTGIGAAVLLGAAGYGGWHFLFAGSRVSTDNAYVGADTAMVTPMIGGQVAAVLVNDTQPVQRGQILIRIDDSDARIALASAEAELARVQRQFDETKASGTGLLAQVDARGAEIVRARAQLASAEADAARAKVDYDRRRVLSASGAVSGDELTSATNRLAGAQAALALARAGLTQAISTKTAAQSSYAANQALTRGITASDAPEVLAVRARVDQARLDLARTAVRAPLDGVVTRRTVQVGQRLAPGATAMMIVPTAQMYVDANFKEAQLARVKPGQKAVLTSDLYGGDVKYHGRVVGFSGGTGASFALIPAQNATGNWIKVVQRLPVRIALDPRELAQHPLRVGLSMEAEVELGND
ncbi:MAG TPA: HlyD family efflux transporter periplasmic adaptor subunit [Sphingomonas sp.]